MNNVSSTCSDRKCLFYNMRYVYFWFNIRFLECCYINAAVNVTWSFGKNSFHIFIPILHILFYATYRKIEWWIHKFLLNILGSVDLAIQSIYSCLSGTIEFFYLWNKDLNEKKNFFLVLIIFQLRISCKIWQDFILQFIIVFKT